MARLIWGNGTGIGLRFIDNSEYYETLGYLCKTPAEVVVYTHQNDVSGAWAGQGKLETRINKNRLPSGLKRSFDLSGDNRLSVSDYVDNLVQCHAFTRFVDPTGRQYTYHIYPESIQAVRNTVPAQYLRDFDRGYNL